MKGLSITVAAFSTFIMISSSPYDDGKYYPKKYSLDGVHDDGQYYRPSHEGKYKPGDEGRYSYIYKQFLDGDYSYIHREGDQGPDDGDYGTYAKRYGYVYQGGPNGPNGGFGHGGGFGFIGPKGGFGPNGYLGLHGPKGTGGFGSDDEKDWYEIGYEPEGSENHYTRMSISQLKSIVCSDINDKNNTLLLKRYSGGQDVSGERVLSLYKMKGSKTLISDDQTDGKVLGYRYEIVVTVTEQS